MDLVVVAVVAVAAAAAVAPEAVLEGNRQARREPSRDSNTHSRRDDE